MTNRSVNFANIQFSDTSWVIDEFFIEDRKLTSNSKIRISVLLAATRDLKFLRGVFLNDQSLNLSKSQKSILRVQLPSFAAILVFCSVVDLLARVYRGRIPKNGKNKKFFISSCRKWFNLSTAASQALWLFRNSVSHQYIILPNSRTLSHGFSGIMRYSRAKGIWEYNLNGMYSSIRNASNNVKQYIQDLGIKSKTQRANFIYKNGFIYTPAF